jgi:Protein of unknown function (DUF550)
VYTCGMSEFSEVRKWDSGEEFEFAFTSPSSSRIKELIGPDPMKTFWDRQAEWSQATFGSDSVRGPIGPLKHLAKEAVEAQEAPHDLKEYVDCQFLTFDAARRAGFTYQQLIDGLFQKLEENKQRTWPDWRTQPANEAIEHVREDRP